MVAAEGAPHRRTQVLGDPVAGHPSAGPGRQGRGAVRPVLLWADDDDPVGGESVRDGAAARREVGRVEDEEVGVPASQGVPEWLCRADGRRQPAAVVTGEQFPGEAAHGRVADGDENPGLAVADRTVFKRHGRLPVGARLGPLSLPSRSMSILGSCR